MALLLAVGSQKVDASCWYNTSVRYREIAGYDVLHGDLPLFVSQYGLGWFDAKGKCDRDGVDFHANAIKAALANRTFCVTTAAKQHATYARRSGGWWGISAGDSAEGYVASGPIYGESDGTVWPMTALASIPWIPEKVKNDQELWQASRIWTGVLGKYGVAPFNLDTGWVGKDLIGIDLGAFLINFANHRNRTVWDLWMKHSVPQMALERMQFSDTQ